MEEDKKRKKNKKKKNKQNKAGENSSDGAREHITSRQNHDQETSQKNTGRVHEMKDAQNDVFPVADADQLRNVANGPEVSTLADSEKEHHWLEREASLKEKIRQLHEERDAQIQNEVVLEEKIQQFLKEKDISLAREGSLLKQIKQSQSEKAILEHQISQLEKEKEACAQRESSLAENIGQLQSEKEAHMQKEVQFEEKINLLLDEATKLSSEKVILEYKAKQMEIKIGSWVQKENSNEEIIAALNVENSRLLAQVLQLEQSRNTLLEENQQLRGSISDLQSQILNFEENTAPSYSSTAGKMQTIENGDTASQMEAADLLVEKLITENAELVEKINELYIELNRRSLQKDVSYDNSTPGTAESAVADNSVYLLDLKVESDERQHRSSTSGLMPGTGANMSMSSEMVQNGRVADKDKSYECVGVTATTTTGVFSNSSEVIDSDEIVQIPLDENGRLLTDPDEIVQIPLDENERLLTDPEAGNNVAEKTEVPISHAPLIGAPFRIISFVTRYVSGADLVERNSVATR